MAKAHAVKSVFFNGSQVTSVQNGSYNKNPETVISKRGDDEQYNTLISVRGFSPAITFQTIDLEFLETIEDGNSGPVIFEMDEVDTGVGQSAAISGSASMGVVTSANSSWDINGESAYDITITFESQDGNDPVEWLFQ